MTSITEINLMRGLPNGIGDHAVSLLRERGEMSSKEMMDAGISPGNFPKVIALLCARKQVNVRTTGMEIGVITKFYSLKEGM